MKSLGTRLPVKLAVPGDELVKQSEIVTDGWSRHERSGSGRVIVGGLGRTSFLNATRPKPHGFFRSAAIITPPNFPLRYTN